MISRLLRKHCRFSDPRISWGVLPKEQPSPISAKPMSIRNNTILRKQNWLHCSQHLTNLIWERLLRITSPSTLNLIRNRFLNSTMMVDLELTAPGLEKAAHQVSSLPLLQVRPAQVPGTNGCPPLPSLEILFRRRDRMDPTPDLIRECTPVFSGNIRIMNPQWKMAPGLEI